MFLKEVYSVDFCLLSQTLGKWFLLYVSFSF